jgi:hypothetical protein
MGFTKFVNRSLYIYVFETVLSTFVLCQGDKIQNILIVYIDDHNISYVLVSKSIHVEHVNLNLQYYQSV